MPLVDVIPEGWIRRHALYRDLAKRAARMALRVSAAELVCPACGTRSVDVRTQEIGRPRPKAECGECGAQFSVELRRA